MTIAICDDMLSDRAALTGMLNDWFASRGKALPSISSFQSAEEFLSEFSAGRYQLIFMDIYLGGLDGVSAARRVRESDESCALVFITTSADHAIDSYTVHASDYIVKPFSFGDVEQTMDWCLTEFYEKNRSIEIISERERRNILINDIVYVEVRGRECIIHTTHGPVSTNRSLGDIESALAEDSFLRCHRSYLLNMSYIVRPDKNDFIVKNGDRVPIGTDNLTRTKQRYYDWSFASTWKE